MNQMEIFKNPEFGSIRTFEQDDKVLFCGKDIAKALGYQRTADAITAHCKGVCVLPTPSNGGMVPCVSPAARASCSSSARW